MESTPQPASSMPGRALRRALSAVFWTAVFAVAYTQSPLYTSNQNQYFLHGLAQAGYGTLAEDWLANTSDPTPVFSGLVALSYRLTGQHIPFYLYYALLMGIYLHTLLGIAARLVELNRPSWRWLALLAGVVLVHSAGWRYALGQFVGIDWMWVLEDGLAGQRMLGLVFQPSTFGVLLLLAVYLFLSGRHVLAGLSAAAACVFHPTYLLAAALLSLAFCWVRWVQTRSLKAAVVPGLAALLLALPVAAFVFTEFGLGDAALAAQARQVLVSYRIPHHALISQWLNGPAWLKLALVAAGVLLLRPPLSAALKATRPSAAAAPLVLTTGQTLGLLLAFTSLAALVLTLLQALTGSTQLALLFPWRISILIVPLAVTALLASGAAALSPRLPRQPAQLVFTLVLFACLLVGMVRFELDLQRTALAGERPVQAWVRQSHAPGEVFLTPVKMQDFRLAAAAPAFIDFKSIPYRSEDVLEWHRRVLLADRYYQSGDCGLARQLVSEGVTHLVLPVDLAACPGFDEQYRDGDYAVYKAVTAP